MAVVEAPAEQGALRNPLLYQNKGDIDIGIDPDMDIGSDLVVWDRVLFLLLS